MYVLDNVNYKMYIKASAIVNVYTYKLKQVFQR